MALIDQTGLTKFGDMTVIAPGLENLADGDPATSARSAGTTGWYGVILDPPRRIERLRIRGLDGLGFDSSGSVNTITLRGYATVAQAVPPSRTSGLLQANPGSFTDTNGATWRELVFSDQETLYGAVWYEHITGGGFARAADVEIVEAPEPVPVVVPDFSPMHARPAYSEKVIGPISLPLTTGIPYNYNVAATIFIPDIAEGDEIDAKAEFQVTSPYAYNVMCSSCLILATSPSVGDVNLHVMGDLDPGEVIKINNHNGQNFNGDEHHYTKARVATWVADQDYPEGVYLNFVIYAASSAAGSGHAITINSAFLWARHWRQMPVAP